MTVAYVYGNSLYLNITNRCSNSCTFCVRTQADGFYADDLWLKREPTRDEIIDAVRKADPDTVFSVVKDTITDADIEKCRETAVRLGVPIRVRDYIKT